MNILLAMPRREYFPTVVWVVFVVFLKKLNGKIRLSLHLWTGEDECNDTWQKALDWLDVLKLVKE